MRAIKFRAWDNKRNKWCESLTSVDNFIGFNLQDFYYPILSQFTGQKDRNGKEIYEGDICNVNQGEDKFEMVWKGIGFWFKRVSDGELFVFTPPVFWIEVIGNIYENPKLIKG